MQKSEDAVILSTEIAYLIGSADIDLRPNVPFSARVGLFLDSLAKELRADAQALHYPDIQTFAFWIRQAHFKQLKARYLQDVSSIGRGCVFHIAPANVPINFAYSLVFGLLSGNTNIVRVSSKFFPQVDIICAALKRVFVEFPEFEQQMAIIRYPINKQFTDDFSSRCDVRIIWGGDDTINEIRQSPLKPRATELTFADRYSFAIIDLDALANLDEAGFKTLAKNFYNDTYLMDQNACSAPHMIFWRNKSQIQHQELKQKFWWAVYEQAHSNYALDDIKVMDKFTELFLFLANYRAAQVSTYANYLYVISLNSITSELDNYRGHFGLFYEYELRDLDDLAPLVNSKIQTCAVFGIDRQEVVELILKQHLVGIDRIVPIGATLDMDLVWDGYNIIHALSRQLAF